LKETRPFFEVAGFFVAAGLVDRLQDGLMSFS
jgi:hypothetical protein